MNKTMIPQETTKHLHALHGQLGAFQLRLINDRDKTRPVLTFRSTLDRLPEVWPEIDRLNREEHYGVFVVVNKMPAGSAGKDSDVTDVSAWYYEVDDRPKEEQWKLIEQMPVPPSLVVETKKSLHVYFLAAPGAKTENYTRIQEKQIRINHADKTIKNLSRVMRVPGTWHNKAEPFLCRLRVYEPSRIYSEEEFEAALDTKLPPDNPPPAGASPAALPEKREYRRGTAEELDILCKECLFIRHCKEHANILGEPDWLAMITEIAPYEGAVERIHEYSRHYPRYTQEETDAKIQHFRDSGTGPMLCTTIAEKGDVDGYDVRNCGVSGYFS